MSTAPVAPKKTHNLPPVTPEIIQRSLETRRKAQEARLALWSTKVLAEGTQVSWGPDCAPGVGIKVQVTHGTLRTPRGAPWTHVWYLAPQDPRLDQIETLVQDMVSRCA